MSREFADVALGGLTIGFACVEINEARNAVGLACPGLFSVPMAGVPEVKSECPCTCRSEDLAFARVKSRRGAPWTLGVRVCAVHRALRAA